MACLPCLFILATTYSLIFNLHLSFLLSFNPLFGNNVNLGFMFTVKTYSIYEIFLLFFFNDKKILIKIFHIHIIFLFHNYFFLFIPYIIKLFQIIAM